MGLLGHIKNWAQKPLNSDPVSIVIIIGVVFIGIWLWNSTILAIGRIGKAVTS